MRNGMRFHFVPVICIPRAKYQRQRFCFVAVARKRCDGEGEKKAIIKNNAVSAAQLAGRVE